VNYLGHCYLSGTNEDILFGNFIADAIKGKQYETFPEGIQKGILLHRFIDSYTDSHPELKLVLNKLYPTAGKMAGVVLDIFIDHILGQNWHQFHPEPLLKYTQWCYNSVGNKSDMPKRTQFLFEHMRATNWMYNYQFEEGFIWAVTNIGYRMSRPFELEESAIFCVNNSEEFRKPIHSFLEEIKNEVSIKLNE
jgi:acyl carrier protein phosphodiesterase